MLNNFLNQNNTKYDLHGINVESNNNVIIPRNDNGNVIVQPTSSLLVFEGIRLNVIQDSVLPLINTRFEYFKFPVTTNTRPDIISLDVEIPEEDSRIELKLPIALDENRQPIERIKINTSYPSSWYYNDIVTSGYRELPFEGGIQGIANGYMIKQSLIDSLKAKKQSLKFTIQAQFQSTDLVRTRFKLQLNRFNAVNNRQFNNFAVIAESNAFPLNNTDNPLGFSSNEYPLIKLEYYLNPNQMIDGDTYRWSAVAGNTAWVLASTSYWFIDKVDNTYLSNSPIYPGIYDVFNDNALENSEGRIIALRTAGTGQQLDIINSSNTVTTEENQYAPIGVPGSTNGEVRMAPSGQPYTWDSSTQQWRPA
jgi:hypothetical protein